MCESIRKSILTLPHDTMLLSGHSPPMTVAMLAEAMRIYRESAPIPQSQIER